MQLFRDRSRDEHGLFATVRFWFDLLTRPVLPRSRASIATCFARPSPHPFGNA